MDPHAANLVSCVFWMGILGIIGVLFIHAIDRPNN